jgi:hypothetical protein
LLEEEQIFSELDFKITDKEIIEGIFSIKNKKSSGMDMILNEMLKSSQSLNMKKDFWIILGIFFDKSLQNKILSLVLLFLQKPICSGLIIFLLNKKFSNLVLSITLLKTCIKKQNYVLKPTDQM